MKKNIFLFVYCLIVGICPSCDNTNTPTRPDEAMPEQIAIIKLTPEIQKHVFVSPIVDSVVVDYSNSIPNLHTLYYGKGLVLCNPTKADSILSEFAQEQLHLLGTSPYIILDNGYAIIDWKWAHFQPLSGHFRSAIYSSPKIYDNKAALSAYSTNSRYQNGPLANEEYYILPIKWTELEGLNAIWGIEHGTRIEKPEIRYANVEDVEKYGYIQNIKSHSGYYYKELNTLYNLYSNEPGNFAACVEEIDSIQAVHVGILNLMIKNNDLETWTIKRK